MKMFNENLDELVFENRNKAYGAYVIRKEYADSVKLAVAISTGFIGVLAVCAIAFSNKMVSLPDVDLSHEQEIHYVIDPPICPPKPPAFKLPSPATVKTSPVVVDDTLEEKKITIDAVANIEFTNENGNDPGSVEKNNFGNVDADPELPTVPVDPPELIADEMPNMEGGVMNYLKQNLRYPSLAVDNKTKGTVFLSFVVEKDGSVNDIKILKGIGDGCEEEAIRVVKGMKWKSGKNHGHPVRVQFNLPIKFSIAE